MRIIDIDELKMIYKNTSQGGHWFDQDTIRFFNSRISNKAYHLKDQKLVYFISSEQYNAQSPRLYSIRLYNSKTGQMDTIGEFQQYKTSKQAKRQLDLILNESGNG